MIRDDLELAFVVGYIMANPVRAGLVAHPSEHSYLGSQRYTVAEMLEICEYTERWVGIVSTPAPDGTGGDDSDSSA
jgi:hypothetical protein